MLILFVIVVCLISYLASFHPKIFIILYLALFSGFFGFIHPEDIYPFSFENLIFISNMAMLTPFILKRRIQKLFNYPLVKIYLVVFIFGLIYPTIKGWSSLIASLTDGKDFLCILIVPYLMNNQIISSKFIQSLIIYIAIYLGFVCIVFLLFNIYPRGYEPVSLEAYEGIHIRFATVMILALFIAYCSLREKFSEFRLLFFLALLLLLLFQPHLSVTLGAIFAIGFHTFHKLKIAFRMKLLDFSVLLFSSLVLILIFLIPTLNNYLVEIFNQIFYFEGAFGSRININAFRIEYFIREPILGYGFIDETSSLGSPIKDAALSRFTETLGAVDSGIIDIAIRFGLIGLLGSIVFIFIALKELNHNFLLFKLILITYLIASPTWACFTYSFGIVILSLAYVISLKAEEFNLRSHFILQKDFVHEKQYQK